MHELSLAQQTIGIIKQNVPADELPLVRFVKLRIGELTCVVPGSLRFCFEAAAAGTPLGGAELVIEQVPFLIECKHCRQEIRNEAGTALCPICGGNETSVISGTELEFVEIELTDHPTVEPA